MKLSISFVFLCILLSEISFMLLYLMSFFPGITQSLGWMACFRGWIRLEIKLVRRGSDSFWQTDDKQREKQWGNCAEVDLWEEWWRRGVSTSLHKANGIIIVSFCLGKSRIMMRYGMLFHLPPWISSELIKILSDIGDNNHREGNSTYSVDNTEETTRVSYWSDSIVPWESEFRIYQGSL